MSHYRRAEYPFGYVYLMGITERQTIVSPLKVGIAARPKRRLADLQVGSPFKLEIIGTWKLPSLYAAGVVEKKFHKENKALLSHGEWVNIAEEDAKSHIQRLVVDFWKIRRHKSASGAEYLTAGNLIAISNSLTKAQAATRRRAFRAAERDAPVRA